VYTPSGYPARREHGPSQAGFADYPILAYNLKQGGFPEVRLV